MKGTFYGIGVGPGDPELLTMKAVKAIEKVDIIIAPKTETFKPKKQFAIDLQPYSMVMLEYQL